MGLADLIAEAIVEGEVARQLAAHSYPDFPQSVVPGIVMRPLHERSPDTTPLVGGVNGNPAHVQVVGVRLEAQPSHHLTI